MQLDSVQVSGFRSIQSTYLSSCGGFNVLIGKNNSGKSNILLAISTFFDCIKDGSVINIDAKIGNEIDFYDRDITNPIEITLAFLLSSSERDDLVHNIVTEAPQMKNAVDGIGESMYLFVTVKVKSLPKKHSFISKIVIKETSSVDIKCPERVILFVEDVAARELYEKASSIQQRNSEYELLRNVDRSALRALMEYKKEGRQNVPIEYLFRQAISSSSSLNPPSRDIIQIIERIIETSSSSDDALREIRSLAAKLQTETETIYKSVLKSNLGTFSGDQSSIPNYVQKLLNQTSKVKVLYIRERRKTISTEEAQKLLELKVRRGGTERLRNIQETVNVLLGVQIDAFQGYHSSSKSENSAELDVDNFLVQVNGSGIRESLRLVLDYEFEKPQILLVEEPEVHLHPALETGLMRYLKRISKDCQIFLTTHSTNFLDTGDMKNVYLVSKTKFTTVRLIDVEEAESQIPRELGIRLSSLFMFDRLVFVEGASDEDIIREWASIIGVNFGQANVGFVHMGGVRNMTHFATEKTLTFLTKRQVKIWFIMDRDEKDDKDVEKIYNILGDKAKVKILSKREIENYMIRYRPIVEFIKYKKMLASSSEKIRDFNISTDEYQSKLSECAERLKQISINRRVMKILCQPVYPNRGRLADVKEDNIGACISEEIDRMIGYLNELRGQINKVSQEQQEIVDNRWDYSKLDMVPGDILLDLIFKEYGVRFLKERDGAKLASLMRLNEIDSEIIDMIREIVE